MRNEYLRLLKELKNTDVSKSPRCILSLRFHKILMANDFDKDLADDIVAGMKIDVSEDFIKDEELMQACIDAYLSIIKQARELYSAELFRKMMQKNEVTITYQL